MGSLLTPNLISKIKRKLISFMWKITEEFEQRLKVSRVHSVLKHWNIENSNVFKIKIEKQLDGTDKSTWFIESSSGKYILKSTGSPLELGRWIMLIMGELVRHEFPYFLPCFIPDRKGDLLVNYKGSYWWLYKFIEGNSLDFFIPNSISAHQIGSLVAEFHQVVRNVDIQNFSDFQLKLFDANQLNFDITFIKNDCKYISNPFVDVLIERINIFLDAYNKIEKSEIDKIKNLKTIPIHYDFNGGNILSDKNSITGLIDFEYLAVGSRLIDIQNSLFYTASDDQGLDLDRVSSFMQGYCSVLRCSFEEISLIYSIMLERSLVLLVGYLKHQNMTDFMFQEGDPEYRLVVILSWLIDNKKSFLACLIMSSNCKEKCQY